MNNDKMRTERINIKVARLVEEYQDLDWDGVFGFGGKLDIRPKYQREFIYDLDRQRKVIDTVINRRPLNIMYWVQRQDGNYDLLDGQQRTLSICNFFNNKVAIFDRNGNKVYFHSMNDEDKQKILDYDLEICICDGSENEIYDWFRTININGLDLKPQEMLNATYTGEWLTDARRRFSKPRCAAHELAKDYLNGSVERQDYLETALRWINDGDVQGYMAVHRNDPNATELWDYFEGVINWVRSVFKVYRKEMRGLNWGKFYNEFHDQTFDANEIERRVSELMSDDEIQKQSGIYEYILTGNEKALSLRAFDSRERRIAYERQNGHCPYCDQETDGENRGKVYRIEEMEADHITPWSKGGQTTLDNCQMLCQRHNNLKTNHLM